MLVVCHNLDGWQNGRVVSLVCLINNQPIILLSISTRPAKTQCQRLSEKSENAGSKEIRGQGHGQDGDADLPAFGRTCNPLCCPPKNGSWFWARGSGFWLWTRNTAQSRNKFWSATPKKIHANAKSTHKGQRKSVVCSQ